MKAVNRLAVVLSLFILSLPIQAEATEAKPASSSIQSIKKIDLNTVDVATLTKAFKGIGKKRAQAIVDYRKAHDGFESIEELAQVKGLGKRFVTHHLAQLQEIFTLTS